MWGWIKSAASSAASWVNENKAAIASTVAAVAVGTIVTLAVAAFIVGTGGLGAGLVAAVATGVISGAVGGAAAGAAGYGTGLLLDKDRKFAARDLGKAVLIGALVGGISGGVLKGVGGGAAAQAAHETAEITASEVARKAVVNAALGAGTGGGGQVVANAVENLVDGAPVTSNLLRGVPRAVAFGAVTGLGSTVAEPLTTPVLGRVNVVATRVGRSIARRSSLPRASSPALGPLGGVLPENESSLQAAPQAEGAAPQETEGRANLARGPPASEPESLGLVRALETGKVGDGSGATDAAGVSDASTQPLPGTSEPEFGYRGFSKKDHQHWALRDANLGEEVSIEPTPVPAGQEPHWRDKVWLRSPETAAALAGPDGVLVRRPLDGTERDLPHNEVHVEGEQKGEVVGRGVSINEEFGDPADIHPPKAPLDETPFEPLPQSREAAGDLEPGEYVFVRDTEGKLHVAPNGDHHHPRVLGGGRSATMAGTLKVGANGEIEWIANDSGTFQFPKGTLNGVKEQAVKQGLKWTRNSRLKGFDDK